MSASNIQLTDEFQKRSENVADQIKQLLEINKGYYPEIIQLLQQSNFSERQKETLREKATKTTFIHLDHEEEWSIDDFETQIAMCFKDPLTQCAMLLRTAQSDLEYQGVLKNMLKYIEDILHNFQEGKLLPEDFDTKKYQNFDDVYFELSEDLYPKLQELFKDVKERTQTTIEFNTTYPVHHISKLDENDLTAG